VTRVGQFDDPASEAELAKFLIERRDAIVRRYLPAVNPVVDVQLTDGKRLTFRNAAVDAADAGLPMEYIVQWLRFDNATGAATAIGTTRSAGSRTSVPVPIDLPSDNGVYIRVELAASGGPASWSVPVHAYFFREHDTWKLVGFERVPDGNTPHAAQRITDARSPAGQRVSTFEARIADAIERNRSLRRR
jgi:hypothetical protein